MRSECLSMHRSSIRHRRAPPTPILTVSRSQRKIGNDLARSPPAAESQRHLCTWLQAEGRCSAAVIAALVEAPFVG
jgi:hypothetical protein